MGCDRKIGPFDCCSVVQGDYLENRRTGMKKRCCAINCESFADWEIYDGNDVDNYTHACTKHVGELLQGEKVSTVYPVEFE